MDPISGSAHASGNEGVGPSSAAGGNSDAVLHSMAQQVMDEISRNFREQGGLSGGHSSSFEKFIKINPLAFSGGTDPTVTENWVKEIKKELVVLQCTEEKRVLFFMYKLTREVERWWTTVKLLEQRRTVPIKMTWDRFKELFFKRYFLDSSREAKVEEFLNLK
ncbi:uncharacterized protein LOC131160885 [Malania oleifera]|uniref:uncharacterized protein LOC131160885 n=1 Tax=Malania oleifera TaxID=397392 RepID=UPI0025AE8C3D|nr:uncharacterized protein LOC131160885 [Malania oleifera]